MENMENIVFIDHQWWRVLKYISIPFKEAGERTVLLLVRERSALADPYCQSAWISICIGSRALSFSGPLLSLSVEFCVCVCVFVRNFEVQYLENQRC